MKEDTGKSIYVCTFVGILATLIWNILREIVNIIANGGISVDLEFCQVMIETSMKITDLPYLMTFELGRFVMALIILIFLFGILHILASIIDLLIFCVICIVKCIVKEIKEN